MKNAIAVFLSCAATALLLAACSPESDPQPAVAEPDNSAVPGESQAQDEAKSAMMETFISESGFGTTADGQGVTLYTLQNRAGMMARITNYGGIVVSLTAPDREGNFEDIVLGYETLAEYEKETPYFGALIGRYGNRIGKGQFNLEGETYQLTLNDGPNHLHGGDRGFDKVVWDAMTEETDNGPSLLLSYVSEDGEEGYPGTLHAVVRYTLTHDNQLLIEYEAVNRQAHAG